MNKMNQFSLVAQHAYNLVLKEKIKPELAWDYATREIGLPDSSAEKNCPKQVFIGLCSQGLLKNIIRTGNYYNDNYGYSRWVIRQWKKFPHLSNSEVWKSAQKAGKFTISHNGQVDVVAGLWEYLQIETFS